VIPLKKSLTISIPTFNRPERLKNLLGALSRQDSFDFVVNISDNNSDNLSRYRNIVNKNYPFECNYHRQEQNIGHINNFKYLLKICSTELHAWIADDDIPSKNFVSECIKIHQNINPEAALVFFNYLKRDTSDNVDEVLINNSEEFERYSFLRDSYDLLYSKSDNKGFYKKIGIYGVFKTKFLKNLILQKNFFWSNERDLLYLIRQYGVFAVSNEKLLTKSTGPELNLDKKDPYYQSIKTRGSVTWFKRMISASSYSLKVFNFLFLLPLFIKINLLILLKWLKNF